MMKTSRIETLQNKLFAHPRKVSTEQAQIITRIYQENPDLSAARKRALSLKAALSEIEISIEPEELIVGNRTCGVRDGVIFPESGISWVLKELDTLPTRDQDPFDLSKEDAAIIRDEIGPYWAKRSLEAGIKAEYGPEIAAMEKVVKINQKDHAQGHICPNTPKWLALGPFGLLQESSRYLEQESDPDKREFYENMVTVLEGACIFMERYAALASKMADDPDYAAYEANLREVSQICGALSKRPPETFHEALQAVWFLFVILHMESNASSFSPGRMDQYLLSYYQNDLDAGILNEEAALELLECFWLKCNEIVYLRNQNSARYFAGFPIGFNIAIGGQNDKGEDASNALSWLCLQAQKDLGLPQPNLSVRLHTHTPQDFLEEAVRVVARGSGMPQFFNDEAIIEPMQTLGISRKDAMNYAIVGCVELTSQGNALGWSDAAMFNMNKALELTLNHGICLLSHERMAPDFGGLDSYESYEELEAAYARTLDFFIEEMMKAEDVVEKAHQDHLPTAFLSAVIDDCMQKGLDVTKGGARYNLSGIQIIQAANLADSLAALKMLVYDEGRLSGADVLTALRNNFEGDEILQTMLAKKAPKYGNDVAWVDDIAAKWAMYMKERLSGYTNYRGGPVHTGMYTVSAHVPMGDNTGASADGRKAGTPLADGGLSPAYGRDLAGPTAVLKSVSRIPDLCTTNGGLLNMKFLPSFFETEKGIASFAQFLRAFTALHIPHIQFNVVRREDLLDAKAHPQNHRSLTVRVAGYTAYFTELAGKLQDEIIERTFYDHL